MDENTDIYQDEIPTEDELEAFMPDGWAEGDDFFEPDSWTGESGAESASEPAQPETEEGTPEETVTEDAPAIEQTQDTVSTDTGDNTEVPATDPEVSAPSTKRRVRYQFDHQDREEEIDDADLPELLQKARSVDRYKARLDESQILRDRLGQTAKVLHYDSPEAFLDALLDNAKTSEMEVLRGKGVPDELIEDYVGRKYADASAIQFPRTQPLQLSEQPQQAAAPQGRDYVSEARELLDAHPELVGKQLPPEVYAATSKPGVSLLQAYTEYERKSSQAEAEKARRDAEKLRKENRILKNNADSADRAPVSGVSKGGRAEDKEANDPFLAGFNSLL